jgi:hypothetical protein
MVNLPNLESIYSYQLNKAPHRVLTYPERLGIFIKKSYAPLPLAISKREKVQTRLSTVDKVSLVSTAAMVNNLVKVHPFGKTSE